MLRIKPCDRLFQVDFWFELLPTKSYGWRKGRFKRYTRKGFRVVGVVELHEAKREGARAKVSRYSFADGGRVKGVGRLFVFYKGFEAGASTVTLSDGGKQVKDTCTCQGFGRHGDCKHLSTLREMLKEGLLPEWRREDVSERDQILSNYKLPKSKKDPRRGK